MTSLESKYDPVTGNVSSVFWRYAIPEIIEILELAQLEIEKKYKEKNSLYLTLCLRETMKIARELEEKHFDELNKKLEENGLGKIDKWGRNH